MFPGGGFSFSAKDVASEIAVTILMRTVAQLCTRLWSSPCYYLCDAWFGVCRAHDVSMLEIAYIHFLTDTWRLHKVL